MSRDDTINMEHYEILSLAHKICNVCQKLSKRCPGGLCGNAVRKAKEIYYSQFAKDKKVRANGMREKQMIEEMRKDIFAAFGGYEKWEEDWQSLAQALYNAGYRKQEWISVDERLPEENVYVLIAVGNSIQVARIIKGISEEKREKMKNGELPDPEESCFAADKIITLRRSQLYRSGDVWGNNLVPYYWKANGGPMEWFGQNITHWMPLPEPPKMKGGAE